MVQDNNIWLDNRNFLNVLFYGKFQTEPIYRFRGNELFLGTSTHIDHGTTLIFRLHSFALFQGQFSDRGMDLSLSFRVRRASINTNFTLSPNRSSRVDCARRLARVFILPAPQYITLRK